MNFFGLGFIFRSRDEGLLDQQASVSKGFLGMTTAYDRFNKKVGRNSFNMLKDKGLKRAEGVLAALRAELGRTTTSSVKYHKILGKIVNLQASVKLAKSLREEEKALASLRKERQQYMGDAAKLAEIDKQIAEKEEEVFNKREEMSSRQEKLTKRMGSHISVMAGYVQDIGQNGLNLTTSFEATIQHNEKAARQVALNYGYTGKELGKIASKASGLAIELNMNADETTRALRAWGVAQKDLTSIGLRSAKEVAKFSSVTGVQADMLVDTTRRMNKELGFGDKELKMVMGTFTRFGQETGNVSGALEAVPGLLGALSKQAALAGYEMDQMKLAKMGTQVAALARGLHATGSSQQEALQFAQSMAEHLVDARSSIGKMFAGTESDLPKLAEALSIGLGDANEAFKMMNQGPEEFMSGLARMVQAAKKDGRLTGQQMDFLRSHLADAFGDEQAARMVNFFRSADKETLKSMANVKQATASLGKMANEGYRTGRTLAESFQLAQDRFVASFRSISRVEARNFVKDTGAEFNKFSKQLKGIAGEDGLMGALVRKFSELHQLGALALVPKTLRPMVSLFGGLLKEILPLLPGIAVLGSALAALFSPIGLIIAGLAAAGGLIYWFYKTENAGSKMATGLGKAWDWLKDKMSAAWDYLKGQAHKLAPLWDRALGAVAKFIHKAADFIRQMAAKVPEMVTKYVVPFLKKALPIIWDVLKKTVAYIIEIAPDIVDALWELSKSMLHGVGLLAKEAVNALGEWIADVKFGDMIADLLPSWSTISAAGRAAWDAIKGAFWTFLRFWESKVSGFIDFWKRMKTAGMEAITAIYDKFKEWGRWLEDKLLYLPRKLKSVFSFASSDTPAPPPVSVPVSVAPAKPGQPAQAPSTPARAAAVMPSGQAMAMIEAINWPKWYQEHRVQYAHGVDRIVTMLNAGMAKSNQKTRFKTTMADEIGLTHLASSDSAGNPR